MQSSQRPSRRSPFVLVVPAVLALSLGMGACSPTYNWREVRFDDAAPLVALLPCKPDHAQRPVSLDGKSELPLSMMGCETGGATFTLSHVHIEADGDEPGAAIQALSNWQAANQARLAAKPSSVAPFAPQGAEALPGSTMIEVETQNADHTPVRARLASFVVRAGTGRAGFDLYQAAIYRTSRGGGKETEAADNFFSSLRLP